MHETATQHTFTGCLVFLASTCSTLNKTREAEELYREAIGIIDSQYEAFGNLRYNELLIARTNLACLLLQEAGRTGGGYKGDDTAARLPDP
jgi:hypothetical protein